MNPSGHSSHVTLTDQQKLLWQDICLKVDVFTQSLIPSLHPKHDLDIGNSNKQKLALGLNTLSKTPQNHSLAEMTLVKNGLEYFTQPQAQALLAEVEKFHQSITVKPNGSFDETIASFWQGSDACAYHKSDDRALFAIADGVTNSRNGEILSHHLVKSFCDASHPDSVHDIQTNPQSWLEPIRDACESYYQKLYQAVCKTTQNATHKGHWRASPLAVFQRKSAHQYMSSTFVGLEILPEDSTGKKKWRSVGVGDSLLFQLRKTQDQHGNSIVNLQGTFPPQSNFSLNSSDTDSISTSNNKVKGTPHFIEGEYTNDDIFVMATDELSRYILLKQIQANKTDWQELLTLKKPSEFQTFIHKNKPDLGDDDDTLIVIPAQSVFSNHSGNPQQRTIVKSSLEQSDIESLIAALDTINSQNLTASPIAPVNPAPTPNTLRKCRLSVEASKGSQCVAGVPPVVAPGVSRGRRGAGGEELMDINSFSSPACPASGNHIAPSPYPAYKASSNFLPGTSVNHPASSSSGQANQSGNTSYSNPAPSSVPILNNSSNASPSPSDSGKTTKSNKIEPWKKYLGFGVVAGVVAVMGLREVIKLMHSTPEVTPPLTPTAIDNHIQGLSEVKKHFDSGFIRQLMDAGGQSRMWEDNFSNPQAAMEFFQEKLGNEYVQNALTNHQDASFEQQLKIISHQIGTDTQAHYDYLDTLSHVEKGTTYNNLSSIAQEQHDTHRLYNAAAVNCQKQIDFWSEKKLHINNSSPQATPVHQSNLETGLPLGMQGITKAVACIGTNMAVRHAATASFGTIGGVAVSCALTGYAVGAHLTKRVEEEYRKIYGERNESLTREAILQNWRTDVLPVMSEVAKGLPSDFKTHLTNRIENTKKTATTIVEFAEHLPQHLETTQKAVQNVIQKYTDDPNRLRKETKEFMDSAIKQSQDMIGGFSNSCAALLNYIRQRCP